MDRIIRQFKVKRGERDIVYPFTTFPCIFDAKVKGEKLMAYLGQVFTQGIPAGERLSVTSLPELIVKCEKIEDKLTEFAAKADYKGYGNNQHAVMQNHFLDNDPETIATEVPVYDDKYLGHIDILRLGGGLIQVCDFKPKSHRETKAASQVARYMALLAKNTGLPLSLFRGCYFDEKHFYNITL